VLSKLPVDAIVSFQTAVHPANPGSRVFSRDLLAVEILDPSGSERLFTLFNNHLKSHFGDHEKGGQGKVRNDTRRRQQAEMVATIVRTRMGGEQPYVILGDMNDSPEADPLQPLLDADGRNLFNALSSPEETRPAKGETGGHDPRSPAWTYRIKKPGRPPQHLLYDQIWLSPTLASAFKKAVVDRRTKHGGDGSDHDPVWIELDV
jgi:predicted extracellular nuclease